VIEFAGETHPGPLPQNEDAIGWRVGTQVWLVADGLGGHASGEIASRVVKDAILETVGAADASLKPAILRAHEAVQTASVASELTRDMASTVVVAKVSGEHCRVAWCGDSRAYLWRDHVLQQMSRDHSLVENLISSGQITRAEAHRHPMQNQLLQALGRDAPVPDEVEFSLQANDWVVLCSDGLHDTLTDGDIAAVLERSASPDEATRRLVETALENDAEDNVSVITLRSTDSAAPPVPLPPFDDTVVPLSDQKATSAPSPRQALKWILAIAVAFLFLALLIQVMS
jgi:protein phosphatase